MMVAYNFHKRFIEPIEQQVKCQTIRRTGKRRHARPGDFLQLYFAQRTKHCRKILANDPVCDAVFDIVIEVRLKEFARIEISGAALPRSEWDRLAIDDGFSDIGDMHAYWMLCRPIPGTFEGKLISWSENL